MRISILAAFLLLAFATVAQTAPRLAERHARIGLLFGQEAYAEVVREVELQSKEAVGTPWEDSLFGYLPMYGRSVWRTKDARTAVDAAEQLLKRTRKADDHPGREVNALIGLGTLYYDLGAPRESVRVDSMAVTIAERHKGGLSPGLLARAHHALGIAYDDVGEPLRAIPQLEAALIEGLKAAPRQAVLLASIHMTKAGCLRKTGRTKEAERTYRAGLESIANDTSTEAVSRRASLLGNMGILVQRSGDMERSKGYYQQSLSAMNDLITRFASDPVRRDGAIMNRSRIHLNLASVHGNSGDVERARAFLDLCLKDRLSVLPADHPQVIAVNDGYAELEAYAGDLQRAVELFTAQLNSARATYGERSAEHAAVGYRLARVLGDQDLFERADSIYTAIMRSSASAVDQKTDPKLAQAFLERGKMRMRQGRPGEAIKDLHRAKAMVVSSDGTDHDRTAELHMVIAEAALLAGDTLLARLQSDSALALLEDRLALVQRPFAPLRMYDPYLLSDAIHVEVATQRAAHPHKPIEHALLDRLQLAIASLQRNKGSLNDDASRLKLIGSQKKLFDLALDVAYEAYGRTGSSADLQRFLDVAEADRSILLKQRLNGFTGLRYASVPEEVLEREQYLTRELASASVNTAEGSLQTVELAYGRFLDTLRGKYPKYFALRYDEPRATIAQLRDRLVTDARNLLVYAKTDQHLYILVVRTDTCVLLRTPATGLADAVGSLDQAVVDRNRARYLEAAYALYTKVLAPVAPMLSAQELLIIPDAELHRLNFECLLSAPCTSGDFREHLLIQRHTIGYLLSATTALQFAGLNERRPTNALALAPGFSDELKQDYLAHVHDTTLVDRDFLNYVRQPFAVSTAQGLGGSLQARVLVGGEASEQRFRSSADQFGILHLGTHAEMNATNPLYSRLVLSKDSAGLEANADGYMHAYEIYELDLRAQLTVLTACETGVGKNDEGEGVRSLGYSFAYAGCPSLVMSLWSIDEKVSSEIITRFYEHLSDGMPKHMALRQAKLDHLNSSTGELALPYYWAGLVLVGDVGPVEVGGPSWLWLIGAGAIVLAAVVLWRARRR